MLFYIFIVSGFIIIINPSRKVSFLFSDRGLPDGYRHMNGYGSHTFKMVNAEGYPVYCKFHFKVTPLACFCLFVCLSLSRRLVVPWSLSNSRVFVFQTDQGIKNLDPADADRIASTDPDYAIRDLYNAIANGNYPSWSFYVQVMTFEQAEKFPFNPFDLTKVRSATSLVTVT